MDDIHYNAVKHGYVDCPHARPYSSFRQFVNQGNDEPDWNCQCDGRRVAAMNFEDIATSAGE